MEVIWLVLFISALAFAILLLCKAFVDLVFWLAFLLVEFIKQW